MTQPHDVHPRKWLEHWDELQVQESERRRQLMRKSLDRTTRTARPGKRPRELRTFTSEYLHGQGASVPTRTLINARAEERQRDTAAEAAARGKQAREAFVEAGRASPEPHQAADAEQPLVTAFDAESADRVYAARRKRMER